MTPLFWWQEEHLRVWAARLWRYYSWRPRYRLTLTTAEPSAYVDMHRLLVVCNPERAFPPMRLARQVRHLPGDVREFQMRYLEGLIAHEAGHTHHSGAKPAGLLGQLVNIIEDERMERLMARDFPELTQIFQMGADVDAAHSIEAHGESGDLINGCLLHRFTHSHPNWAYCPAGQEAALWPEVRLILEAAWNAPTFDEVVTASRRILALVGRSPDEVADERLESYLDSPNQSLDPEDRVAARPPEDQQGGAPSRGREPRPTRPALDSRASADCSLLREQTEGEARRLAAVLGPPTRPAQISPSRDRGRYRADRDLTGSERPFDLKVGGGKPGLAHLRLAVDVSFSMEIGGRIDQARHLLFVAIHAAQKVEMPVVAIAFDDDPHLICDQTTRPVTALNQAAALTVSGNTRLAPTLRELWRPALPGTSVSLIITDGHLAASDRDACRALREEHRGVVVPVLLGDDEQVREEYVQMFGRCVMIQDPAHLTAHVVSFLRSQMASLRTAHPGCFRSLARCARACPEP